MSLGGRYLMPKEVEYEYIWATIDTAKEKFFIYYSHKLITEYGILYQKFMLLPKINC